MKWKVKVVIRATHFAVVEADDWGEALATAYRLHPLPAPDSSARDVDVLQQLGEPWVRCDGWCDPPADVLVFKRAYGHAFDARDVDFIAARIAQLGFSVADRWNGAGCDSVSFRCAGRKGTRPLTVAQLAHLCAPRGRGNPPRRVLAGE